MKGISWREGSVWGTLAAEVMVYGWYFSGVSNTGRDGGRLVAATVATIVLMVVYHIVLAVVLRSEVMDERDRLIEARSYRAAYTTLVLGMVWVSVLLWSHGSIGPWALVNVLFGWFVGAEAMRHAAQLVMYRRGV